LASLLVYSLVYISRHPDARYWGQTFPLQTEFSDQNKKLFLELTFNAYDRIEDFPYPLRIGSRARGVTITRQVMADPDETFQVTDVGDGIQARLIFAGTSGPYYFVYYEVGGIGYSCVLDFYKQDSGKIEDLGRLTTAKRLGSVQKIKRAITTGYY